MKLTKTMLLCLIALGFMVHSGSGEEPVRTKDANAQDNGHAVRLWNQIATDAIVVTGANAPAASGVLLAIVQLAVYDAVVAIVDGYQPYASSPFAPAGASVDAAVAQSAHDVLIDLLPAQAAAVDALLSDALSTVHDDQSRADGIWVGSQAAEGILAKRAGDGRFADVPYTFLPPGPGVYQPTPPAFSTTPLVPWVARVQPFVMKTPSQFRPSPPPSLNSRRWATGYTLTQAYGDVNSTVRSDVQGETAIFWTEHTVRHWNRNIRAQAARLRLDDIETARLFALTNAAMADAWIGCWDAKYYYNFWRPVTAIQQGDSDGRRDTIGDPIWMPFRVTPNHPEYPGAHACVSTAASYALKRFFRSDDTVFPMDAQVGGVTYVHTFTRYTDAGAEARAARIFGGMHYIFSNEAGAQLGRNIVGWMFENGFFRRVPKGHGSDSR